MRRLVIDASAWLGTVQRPGLAAELFAAFDVCAPTLLRWEIGNVVHGRQAKDFGDLATRKRLVQTLVRHVRLVDQQGREDAIADLVARTGLTFYDAGYLQLAVDESAHLVTEDRRLHAAASKILSVGRVWTLDQADPDRVGRGE